MKVSFGFNVDSSSFSILFYDQTSPLRYIFEFPLAYLENEISRLAFDILEFPAPGLLIDYELINWPCIEFGSMRTYSAGPGYLLVFWSLTEPFKRRPRSFLGLTKFGPFFLSCSRSEPSLLRLQPGPRPYQCCRPWEATDLSYSSWIAPKVWTDLFIYRWRDA